MVKTACVTFDGERFARITLRGNDGEVDPEETARRIAEFARSNDLLALAHRANGNVFELAER